MAKTKPSGSTQPRSGGAGAAQKSKAGGKLHPLSMRTTREVRERLENAAARNGRSLAAEVEERLLGSFSQEEALKDRLEVEFGGAHNYALANLTGLVASFLETALGATWLDNKTSREQLLQAFSTILERLTEPISKSTPKPSAILELVPPKYRGEIGKAIASGFLDQIKMHSEGNKEGEPRALTREQRAASELAPMLGQYLRKPQDVKGLRVVPSTIRSGKK